MGELLASWRRLAERARDAPVPVPPPVGSDQAAWSRYLDGVVRPTTALISMTGARFVGISGAPGSGKSTFAAALASGLPAALTLCLDDFYLTLEERRARSIRFRGGPGSHDLGLLDQALTRLHDDALPLDIPRFSAAADDRVRTEVVRSTPSHVLVEGWLLGYRGEGYEAVLGHLDLLVFLDLDAGSAKRRRFAREALLRSSGGGFSTSEMHAFWDEVLGPGTRELVPQARSSAGLVIGVDADHTVTSVQASDLTVLAALEAARSAGPARRGPRGA